MRMVSGKLSRKYSRIIHTLFFRINAWKARILPRRKIKILFSIKEEWEPVIRNGFQFTRHIVDFNNIDCCNFEDYDLIVPLTIPDLIHASKAGKHIKSDIIPIPNEKTILLCNDKYLLNRELIENGFGEFIPQMGGNQEYPYILKKKVDEWGRNCHIVHDKEQEAKLREKINNTDYFVQKIIAGRCEYATHILFKKGRIVRSLNIKYLFDKEYSIKGPDIQDHLMICRCPYLDIFSRVLASIGFEGLCCINYKTANNKPQIFEINPRCGGSLCPYLFSFVESAIRWRFASSKHIYYW